MGVTRPLGLEMRDHALRVARMCMVEEGVDDGRARTADQNPGNEQDNGCAAQS